jgi:prepilin-type N-terminal cleavage/methylation domain-containing protein
MQTRRAFTLIELLVVIPILVLLMAILLPTLRRARSQAKIVACQSNVRQWALILHQYTSENNGKLDTHPSGASLVGNAYRKEPEELTHCPVVDKYNKPVMNEYGWYGRYFYGNYTCNAWISDVPRVLDGVANPWYSFHWRSVYATKSPGTVPVLLDSTSSWIQAPRATDKPPADEGNTGATGGMAAFCTPRHDGIVNSLFMDWSVRKVGLKELWTLKWHRQFDTRGPWTTAGGVQPENWPEWMRRLKDY